MPQTRTMCPRCHQPIMADLNQLFDTTADPDAKQRLLSGQFNIAHCQSCGYEGSIATPLIYHDAEKELLLTYFPPELGLPVNEQERLIGPLIQQVLNRLPTEKRKGYLLRPQNMLTMQTMVERILEADGVTKEMLQAQEQRINLLQRLMSATTESRVEIAKQEDALIDESFFSILSRLVEGSIQGHDEQSARQLLDLQQTLLNETTKGKELNAQVKETQAAAKALQDAGQQGLTREKLLDLFIEAPSETRITAMVGMARSGMDYQFFQLLSERIEKAADEEKAKLAALREKLLALTQEVDLELQAQTDEVKQLIDQILNAEDIPAAFEKVIPAINELFVEVLRNELVTAQRNNDQARLSKLQVVVDLLQKASTPPAGYALIDELLSAQTDTDRQQVLEKHREEVNQEFLDTLNGVVSQVESQGSSDKDKDLVEALQASYRAALRFSMQANLQK